MATLVCSGQILPCYLGTFVCRHGALTIRALRDGQELAAIVVERIELNGLLRDVPAETLEGIIEQRYRTSNALRRSRERRDR